MKTTRLLLFAILSVFISSKVFAQEVKEPNREVIIYSVFVNVVPNDFRFPLIGFVNIADGNQSIPEIGFVNINGSNLDGVQVGYVNLTGGSLVGAHVGFVNLAGNNAKGAQVGFVNLAGDSLRGTQVGFVNISKSTKGFTLGFVNYTETLKKGVPIGFVSIVKHGGYQAFELYTSEMYPVNMAFKIGVDKFYSSFIASYYPDLSNEFAFGMGFGSVLGNGSLYFNPEISAQTARTENNQQLYNASTLVGYRINNHFNLTAGPSLTYNRVDRSETLNKSSLRLYENEFNDYSKLTLGLRLGLRYSFSTH